MSSQSSLRNYWEERSAAKRFTTPLHVETLAKYVAKDAFILDDGCGYGRTLAELRDSGFSRLTGVDFSAPFVERARREVPEAALFVGDAASLPIDGASFDAVLLFGVLTCVPADDVQKRVVAEARRVLKSGGVLYVNDFLLNDDARNRERYARAPQGRPYGVFSLPEGAVLRHHREEYARDLFRDFETVLFEKTIFPTMNGHQSNAFVYVGRK